MGDKFVSESEIHETSFECKLCNERVVFHINDPESYIALSDEKKFAGMVLGTYRVGHYAENEYHVNVVTVDHKGHWRAYVDSYVDIGGVGKKNVLFSFGDSETKVLEPSEDLEFLAIVDTNEGWVFDIICSTSLLPVEIAKDIMKNFEAMDDEIIQEGILFNLDITIGLASFSCIKLGNMLIISIIKTQENAGKFNTLFEKLLSLNFAESKQILNRESFKLIFEIMAESQFDESKIPILIRLIQDGPKSNPVNIHDFGTIPDLINKVINQKSYPEHLIIAMISLLSGQNTLNELLNQGYLKNYEEITNIIDFIRVKLLTDEYLDYPEDSERVEKLVLKEGVTSPDEETPRVKKIDKPVDMDLLFEDLPPLELEEKEKIKSDIIKPQKTVEKPRFDLILEEMLDEAQVPPTSPTITEEPEIASLPNPDPPADIIEKTPSHSIQSDLTVSTDELTVSSTDKQIDPVKQEPNPKLAEILEKRKKQKSQSVEKKISVGEAELSDEVEDFDVNDESKSKEVHMNEKADDDLFGEIKEFDPREDEIAKGTIGSSTGLADDKKSKLSEIAERRRKQREERESES